MSENRCVCCGEIIPEGRMVCKDCVEKAQKMAHVVCDSPSLAVIGVGNYGLAVPKMPKEMKEKADRMFAKFRHGIVQEEGK